MKNCIECEITLEVACDCSSIDYEELLREWDECFFDEE